MEAGQSAFLLEESDETADVFQCRVGNLPPDTEATIRSVFSDININYMFILIKICHEIFTL